MLRGRWKTVAGRFSPQPVYTYPDSLKTMVFGPFSRKEKKERKKNVRPRVTYLNGFSSST